MVKVPISLLWETLDEKQKETICKDSKVSLDDAKVADFKDVKLDDKDKIYEAYYGKEMAAIIIKAGTDVKKEEA